LPLILALSTFVLAAICGLATNIPLRQKIVTARGLDVLRNSRYWEAPAVIGQLRVAEAQISDLEASRNANRFKASFLVSAIGCEIAATGFLAWAIGVIIYST